MKAIFRYGEFTMIKQVSKAMPVVVLLKPTVIRHEYDESIAPNAAIRVDKLIFRLKKSPEVGEVLQYEFEGEE